MDLWVTNATLITGDGSTVIDRGLLGIQDGLIQVVARQESGISLEDQVLDAGGGYLLPGMFNAHTHGCCTGPLFSSGAPGVGLADAIANVKRHLAQGETALCDLSGLGLSGDVDAVRSATPVAIGLGSCHFPETFVAARLVDGSGIDLRHEQATARQMLEQGDAIAIGEIGSGATLGGGVASYRYIPEAIQHTTGIRIGWAEADRIKVAALTEGDAALTAICDELGLTGRIGSDSLRELVVRYVQKPVSTALSGFEPAVALSASTGVPAFFHTCRESVQTLLDLARKYRATPARLVAGHANHTSMSVAECVAWAALLRNEGVIIDLATVQAFSGMPDILENSRALLAAGLVDMVSTDYGGGRWDPILQMVAYAVDEGLLTLPQAVALVTSNPAACFPHIGAERGQLDIGRRADFVITAPGRVADVRQVYCAGILAYDRDNVRDETVSNRTA